MTTNLQKLLRKSKRQPIRRRLDLMSYARLRLMLNQAHGRFRRKMIALEQHMRQELETAGVVIK